MLTILLRCPEYDVKDTHIEVDIFLGYGDRAVEDKTDRHSLAEGLVRVGYVRLPKSVWYRIQALASRENAELASRYGIRVKIETPARISGKLVEGIFRNGIG